MHLPLDMVYWQIKDAISRGAPNVLMAIHGTRSQGLDALEGLAEYLAKKGNLVKIRPQRQQLTLMESGQRVDLCIFGDTEDVREAHSQAGRELQVIVSNLPMTYDVNHHNTPMMYLMSRVRRPYEEK